MATITVRRSKPFMRGNASIQVFLDGKAAGVITRDEEIIISSSVGRHTIQAGMHGMKGPKLVLSLRDDETLRLTISCVSIPKFQWWETLLFLAMLILPGRLSIDRYFWLIMAFYVAATIAILVATRARLRQMLIIEQEDLSAMQSHTVPAG